MQCGYLGQLRLGEAGLAHLRGLAHGYVALCEWPLGEGLGGPVLAGLAVGPVALPGAMVTHATVPLAAATSDLALQSPAPWK